MEIICNKKTARSFHGIRVYIRSSKSLLSTKGDIHTFRFELVGLIKTYFYLMSYRLNLSRKTNNLYLFIINIFLK
ncbi:unnamed protein product [Nezara viridula]|uniref:Uncharacterized protein n=1 Tax=Nezara viridula TaxID=85310 RepID=A0A9P0E227_NEZVI|nr:unnamed protein product [Nezara viridula]